MLKKISAIINGRDEKARRSQKRLPVTVTLLDPKTKATVKQSSPPMRGYLRDINKNGLSLMMSAVHSNDPFFVCSGYVLQITLGFNNRDISIEAVPVRYNIDEGQDDYKYLIGARIIKIRKSDRKYIDQYLKDGRPVPRVLRSLMAHAHDLLINRVRVRRSGMRLPLNLALIDSKARGEKPSLSLAGFLHDISKTGLSLVVPSVRFGDRYPVGDHYSLRIRIQLPKKIVDIRATPVRYNKLSETKGEQGYLIGARITQLDASDRRQLNRHLQQVRKRNPVASQTSFAHDLESY